MQGRVNRAAQFLPFDSLKGLQEELRRREFEHSKTQKIDLDDEIKDKISKSLLKLKKDSELELTYFDNGHYIKIKGKVTSISFPYKFLIVNDTKIFFDDIMLITIY